MPRCNRFAGPLALVLLVGPLSGPVQPQVSGPMSKTRTRPSSEQYETRQVEGWTVLVNRDFLRQRRALADRTLTLLQYQLYQIVRRVPAEAVKKLRKVRIWVEENEPNTPCMAYHPNVDWLKAHGVKPEKQKCIEVANARNFLDWTLEQPWMVLHELSHAYHHQFLNDGFSNPRVKAAYDRAMKSKIYQKVLRINGREEKAYAATNPMEYFAEATEAFFGTNDFYPFVRSELKRHDSVAYDLLTKVWGVDPTKPADRVGDGATRKAGRSTKAKV
jgi:hypothetical protein